MKVLTDEEIAAMRHLGGSIAPRAIESAVLAKLAAGVSVEPDFDHLEAGIAFVSYRQETLNTAIAAARMQVIEEARCMILAELFDSTLRRNLLEKLHALIGKEST